MTPTTTTNVDKMAPQEDDKGLFLVHTMTVTDGSYLMQAQFLHSLSGRSPVCLGKRWRLKRLQRGTTKRCGGNVVRHHLKAVRINPQLQNTLVPIRNETCFNRIPTQDIQKEVFIDKKLVTSSNDVQLSERSTPEETASWLARNRFGNYLSTFEKFSGDDLLRMTREDLIQICGNADGIRLHNAIHSKSIAPKLKLYVRQDSSPVYSAVFLSSHSSTELSRKLAELCRVPPSQVCDVYLEGPHQIHVQVTDDLLRHVNDEQMFKLEAVQSGFKNGFVFVLKGVVK